MRGGCGEAVVLLESIQFNLITIDSVYLLDNCCVVLGNK